MREKNTLPHTGARGGGVKIQRNAYTILTTIMEGKSNIQDQNFGGKVIIKLIL
jgi:hypothetical protein